jgi:hypothetical protein
MNKIVIRNISLAVVILLLFLILFRNRSPFGKNNTSFASGPNKEITRIELSEGNHKLTLEKAGENWLLNGKTETRKSSIIFIIRILEELKIKSPVSPELFQSEIAGKRIDPVKVKVYEKRKLIRSFLVYKTRSNIYGNIMKMREGAKPFIVWVPGYEGDIGSAFMLNELFWQPYIVFNLLPSEIASVNFENLADSSNSFSIVNNRGYFNLSDGRANLSGWDSTLVARYLSYFTRIPFESWAMDIDGTEKKIIESRQPLYRITVNSVGKAKTILTLWEKNAPEKGVLTKDSDRLFGKTQSRDELFIIRYFDIDPLLKKRSYFFPQ